MSLFEEFIEEFKSLENENSERLENISKIVNSVGNALTKPYMYASVELEEAIKKLKIRAEEPMKVAITGQFSSGKSTFLNALLAKNILPTGITPVTSKVNYIRYGSEFSIMVRYKDGREAFFQVENIANFTDQRNTSADDIDYITLYAPLELLKEIIFVDTPGLNSQSFSDTAATESVLKEVDGIIWLSLIDNAGKMSEADVLEKFMHSYQNKSLCVLNQKDKFSAEQVKQTGDYVKQAFKKYFSEVISISAKQAVEARSNKKEAVLEESFDNLLRKLKQDVSQNGYVIEKQILSDAMEEFNRQSEILNKKDISQNEALLKESNIEAVLSFIYKEIQPISVNAKEFAITQDIKLLIEMLIEQEEKIISIYGELEDILKEFAKEAAETFEELKSRFTKSLNESLLKIEEIIEKIAVEILSKKTSSQRVRYAQAKSGFFRNKKVFAAYRYEAPKINADEIYKKLFFDDDLVGKMFKQYLKSLEIIQDEVNLENAQVFKKLETRVLEWQKPYELIRKNRPLYSDIQFANVRRFASKSYENILKPFSDEINNSFAKISSEFKHVGSLVKFNYQNATEVVVAFLERRIENSIKLYEENPTKFSIYEPKLDEIKERLRIAFHIYELENLMRSSRSFVSKNYDRLSEEFSKINKERITLILENQNEYVKLKNKLISLLNAI
ncbi:MAG: dynamin family protein [Campylobacteraceae bacterium]|jgi:GTPase Era involved in 16S rRNA processing|nr:dynamin family protein [Campylobacteraceae bacterium]